ncbi:MAG: hypothetical protein OEW70_08710 [candidate division WOR-3 bacterium]|nr:hypothetical protein [candidate division WOR-3 bacterium]
MSHKNRCWVKQLGTIDFDPLRPLVSYRAYIDFTQECYRAVKKYHGNNESLKKTL